MQAFGFSRDWPIIHGIPRLLQAYIYIPAEAKALPREGALALEQLCRHLWM